MPILTIDSARLNGTPSAGTVRITASRSPLMDSGSNTVYSGTQTFPLDAQGKLSVSLPATDSPSIGPFTYTVEANLSSGQWIYRGVKLPANVATIDITDAQSASQSMYPTRQEWDAITAGMNTAIEGKVTGTGMTLRHDTSVGTRILLDHPGGTTMLYGDTGWRNITDNLTNGWTAESIHIRRVGSNVYLRYRDLSSAGASSPAAFNLAVGFAPTVSGSTVLLTRYGLAAPAPMQVWVGNTIIPLSDFSPAISGGVASWETNRTWPSTLPGTP